MNNSRRNFIRNTSLVSLGFIGLYKFAAQASLLGLGQDNDISGYGPLSHQFGDVLSLPKGFVAKIISRKGDVMNDGLFSPGMHDGMGVFKMKDNKVMLIRNHEITPGSLKVSPFGEENQLINKINKDKFFDYGQGKMACLGGTQHWCTMKLIKK